MVSCNIDLFIAGCSTDCKHCYVDGGPKKAVPLEVIGRNMKRLADILPLLAAEDIDVSVTLDNEPMNHPQAVEVYDLCKKYLGDYYFHHGSTTGLPLLTSTNPEEILETLKGHGYHEVGLTVHGGHDTHNWMVKNPRAYEGIIDSAKLFIDQGFDVVISLMLSKALIRERDQVSHLLDSLDHKGMYFAITNMSPLDRMLQYQDQRAELEDFRDLRGYLSDWGLDESAILKRLEKCHHSYYMDLIKGLESWNDLPGSETNLYLSLDGQMDLYYGNTGLEISKVGNLQTMSDGQLVEQIISLKANDCYWDSNFSRKSLPDFMSFKDWIRGVNQGNAIYPDLDSFLTYWLMNYGLKPIRPL